MHPDIVAQEVTPNITIPSVKEFWDTEGYNHRNVHNQCRVADGEGANGIIRSEL